MAQRPPSLPFPQGTARVLERLNDCHLNFLAAPLPRPAPAPKGGIGAACAAGVFLSLGAAQGACAKRVTERSVRTSVRGSLLPSENFDVAQQSQLKPAPAPGRETRPSAYAHVLNSSWGRRL